MVSPRLQPQSGLGWYLEPPTCPALKRADMPVCRLDDVLTDVSLARIRLLDIDVEGWERHVVDAAVDCLRRTNGGCFCYTATSCVRLKDDWLQNTQEMVVLYSQ